jgi:hypothetical protein
LLEIQSQVCPLSEDDFGNLSFILGHLLGLGGWQETFEIEQYEEMVLWRRESLHLQSNKKPATRCNASGGYPSNVGSDDWD